MDDKKILQAIANVSTTLRTEMIKNHEEMLRRDEERKQQLSGVEKRLTERLDRQGRQLAVLDEDAPTAEDFKYLEKRVRNLEVKVAVV